MSKFTKGPVSVLRPAPSGRHSDCESGCSHVGRAIAGPCQQQCVKTSEFHDQSGRDAAAYQLRFAKLIGANALVVHTNELPNEALTVDCIGLALDLESRAQTVDSQTTERAMRSAAQGLRLIGGSRAGQLSITRDLYDLATRLANLKDGLANGHSSAEAAAVELAELASTLIARVDGEEVAS